MTIFSNKISFVLCGFGFFLFVFCWLKAMVLYTTYAKGFRPLIGDWDSVRQNMTPVQRKWFNYSLAGMLISALPSLLFIAELLFTPRK